MREEHKWQTVLIILLIYLRKRLATSKMMIVNHKRNKKYKVFCKGCKNSLESDKFYRIEKNRCRDFLNKRITCQFCDNFVKNRYKKINCEKNTVITNRTFIVGPSYSGPDIKI